jgi:two-component SAPR family response regulator
MGKLPEFLLYLIVEGQDRGCRWSEVSVAIWPEVLPEKASGSFHQNLKRLRDVIFEAYDYIIVQNDYYQVNPLYLKWCDVLAFEKLFERAAVAPGEQALILQLELINLYQGEFLAGFELGGWGNLYRTRCETRFLQVVKLATEQLLEYNEPGEALTVINKGLAQDYYQEHLHRLAFRAYDQLGLYNQLEAYYGELERMFELELGVPPEPDTEKLFQQLLANR